MIRLIAFSAVAMGLFGTPLFASEGDSFDQVERGRYVAVLGDCTACHTTKGGKLFAGGVVIDTPFGKLVGANITPDPETGIGKWTFEDFENSMTKGHSRDGSLLFGAMPYTAYTKVTRTDNLALWEYLRTVQPVHNKVVTNQLPFPFNIRTSLIGWNLLNFKAGVYQPDASKSDQWNRGAYLAEGLGHCGTCHSSKNLIGGDTHSGYLMGNNLQGWVAPNITSDKHRGIGKWTEHDIVEYLKTGANDYDIASGPMAEAVEHSTQHWIDEDLLAIAVYLKSIPGDGKPVPQPLDSEGSVMKAGAAIYADRCSGCHTPNGEGISHLFPKLAQAPSVNSLDPQSLIRVVVSGSRAGGTDQAPTAPSMPAFAWNLKDEEVASVLTYIRNSWGNAAPAVTAGEVASLRKDLERH